MKIDPLVSQYFQSFGNHKPLPKEEELKLLRRWKKNKKRERKSLEKVILSNLRFVVKCANKFHIYCSGTITINDLIQAGNEGLLRAAEKFNPSRNVRFVTYAVHWIKVCIRMYIYDNSGIVRVGTTPTIRLLIDKKWTTKQMLEEKDPEIVQKWEEDFKKKYKITDSHFQSDKMRAVSVFSISHLDKPIMDGDGSETNLYNFINNNEQFNTEYLVHNKDEQELIKRRIRLAMKHLSPRDKNILRWRYLSDEDDHKTLKQVGEELNISRQRVEQIEKEALKRMKEKLMKYIP